MVIVGGIRRIHPLLSGGYRVRGTVRVESNTTAGARVVCLRPNTLRPFLAVKSAADGSYEITNIAPGQWLVIGQRLGEDVLPDIVRVSAEPMP